MKSNSISSTSPVAQGIGDVPRPRAVTYSGTFHQWFCRGVRASRVLPTICVHICRVDAVASHSCHGSGGHAVALGVCEVCGCANFDSKPESIARFPPMPRRREDTHARLEMC